MSWIILIGVAIVAAFREAEPETAPPAIDPTRLLPAKTSLQAIAWITARTGPLTPWQRRTIELLLDNSGVPAQLANSLPTLDHEQQNAPALTERQRKIG